MKSFKTAISGILALVAGASMAQATVTHINFTGSTAFRGAAVAAIHAAFDSGSLVYGYQGTTEGKANCAVYSGTIGGTAYVIKTAWTGSESGLQLVGDNSVGQAILYPLDVPTVSGTATALTSGGLQNLDDSTVSGATGSFESDVPTVAMADTYQATSQYKSGAVIVYSGTTHTFPTLTGATTTGTFGSNLNNGVVGVIPFVFVASRHADFTNVNDEQIRNLFSSGFLPRALFSGSTADTTVRVYATGRDPDSGTRLSAFADTGIGAISSATQYQPLTSGSAVVSATGGTIGILQLWPASVVNNISVAAGNGGYNSGGKLAGAVGSETSGMVFTNADSSTTTGGDLVTYLSTGDAATAVGGQGIILTYNGVTESTASVEQGSYTFWGYEHMYFLSATSSTIKAIANSIATAIHDTYATSSGLRIGDMNVGRNGNIKDGQPIVPNYSF